MNLLEKSTFHQALIFACCKLITGVIVFEGLRDFIVAIIRLVYGIALFCSTRFFKSGAEKKQKVDKIRNERVDNRKKPGI